MTFSIFYYHWLLSETPECQRWGIWCGFPSACKRVVGWEEFTIWIPKFQFPKLSTAWDWPANLPLQNPNLLQEFTTISSPPSMYQSAPWSRSNHTMKPATLVPLASPPRMASSLGRLAYVEYRPSLPTTSVRSCSSLLRFLKRFSSITRIQKHHWRMNCGSDVGQQTRENKSSVKQELQRVKSACIIQEQLQIFHLTIWPWYSFLFRTVDDPICWLVQ